VVARQAILAVADFLLPRMCVACEQALGPADEGVICRTCWSRLALLPHPQCERCGHPTEGRACRFCVFLPPFVRSARSVCWVPHPVGSAVVHALKYHEWQAAAAGMAERMARLVWPGDVTRERAALVPVPLAATRERERGFNQAATIAHALGAKWGLPVWSDVVVRTRATRSQTRLTPAERSANVRGAFKVPAQSLEPRARMRGQHLVLVDDVLTTGATMNACADVLFQAGARTLSYVSFGRARASGDR
jgi:ComF family protein